MNKAKIISHIEDDEASEEGDEEFLRCRVPFLSERELLTLEVVAPVGRCGFGTVRRVLYEGREAVVKAMLDLDSLPPLLREARMMVQVEGAGGVPEVLAVCLHPPAIVQEFVGDTYVEYLEQCTVGGFLDSLVTIVRLIGEIHAKGIAHNDVRNLNITFTGSVREPVFHMIDLGLACRFGQVAGELVQNREGKRRNFTWSVPSWRHKDEECVLCNDDDEEAEKSKPMGYNWLAPEDVYSFGVMVMEVMQSSATTSLLRPLWRVVNMCTPVNPKRRCVLACATRAIANIKALLTPSQLDQALFLSLSTHT